MTLHPNVPHPHRHLSPAGLHDRALDWIATHVGASVVTFDIALVAPLVVLPMDNTAKLILGVISGSWFQWWMLPAIQRQQMKADRKRDAKADADHIALSHIALTADQILTEVRSGQRSQIVVGVDALETRLGEVIRRELAKRNRP